MFNLFYNSTGKVEAYSETPDEPEDSDIPAGCKAVSLDKVADVFDVNFNIKVKVDTKSKQLILIT